MCSSWIAFFPPNLLTAKCSFAVKTQIVASIVSLDLVFMVYMKGKESETVGFASDLLVLEVWDLQVVTTELEPCFHKLCGGGHAPAPSLLSSQSPLLPRTHTKAEITKDPLKAKTLNPRESVSRHPEQGCDCVFPKLNLRPNTAICLKYSAGCDFFPLK